MPLAALANLFNKKFAQEQGNLHYQPLIVEHGRISALSDQKRIDSAILPVHYIGDPQLIAGFIAVSNTTQFNNTIGANKAVNSDLVHHSIMHFDRLSRTTQLLNAVKLMGNKSNFFVLEISPRHIFALNGGHGTYFKEIVTLCGLQTKNIVCSLTLYGSYDDHHKALLLEGLNNYRALSYQIAVDVGYLLSSNSLEGFIQQLSPDYLLINAPPLGYSNPELRNHALSELLNLKQSLNPHVKIIMREIQENEQILLAQDAGVDLISKQVNSNTQFNSALSAFA